MAANQTSQHAILNLLQRAPEVWAAFDSDQHSEAEATALGLLVAAGLVERRFTLRLRMINHPVGVCAQAVATGEFGLVEAFDKLVAAVWQDWHKGFKQWKRSQTCDTAPFLCERIGHEEWRLTQQGVQAREDLQNGETDLVVNFVSKSGRFVSRPAVAGKGALLRLDKALAADQQAEPLAVRVTNWDECAQALTHLFERLFRQQKSPGHSPPKSGLPEGPGSGPIFDNMLAEYIEKRKEHFNRLAESAIARSAGAAERFEAMFGPRAIARHWLSDWIGKLPKHVADTEVRRQLIEQEENRVAGAIKRQKQYKQRISPPLNGRFPHGWQQPEKSGQPVNSTVAEILNGGQSS